jgi:hypothetical protein
MIQQKVNKTDIPVLLYGYDYVKLIKNLVSSTEKLIPTSIVVIKLTKTN